MNILIVDDNKNNRMILQLLLEDYMEERGITFTIDEAEDGQIAVDKCVVQEYDIILMDIMMPNMDGVEATRLIRESHPKTMIIAVSAVDDSERKKLILDTGAEDYIAKPVNADIFVSRITNYITLIEARHNQRSTKHNINLFTNEVFNRHTNFMLDSEDSLAEFWEFFLLNARKKSDHLSDIVRSVFTIVEKQLQLENFDNNLYIEESDDKQYITLNNIDVFPKKIIELILIKNSVRENFKIEGSMLSFELSKVEQMADEGIETPVVESAATQTLDSEPNKPIEIQASSSLQVFDYMDPDDLYDLEEFAGKLSSILLLVGNGGVTEEEVQDIYTYLDNIGSVLATYGEVYPISEALKELAVDMSSHMQVFIDNAEALGPMCKAFSNDMSNWIEQSFHTGAPSVDFMNDTIVVNSQTISGMLKMDEVPPATGGDDDFDDIFDF